MLSALSPIWFMDPPGEEDENHPPLPLSWQLAKTGPAGGLHSGTWKMFVFSLASASVCFPGMGWEKQCGDARLFCGFLSLTCPWQTQTSVA